MVEASALHSTARAMRGTSDHLPDAQQHKSQATDAQGQLELRSAHSKFLALSSAQADGRVLELAHKHNVDAAGCRLQKAHVHVQRELAVVARLAILDDEIIGTAQLSDRRSPGLSFLPFVAPHVTRHMRRHIT